MDLLLSNLITLSNTSTEGCCEITSGETGRRIGKRIDEHLTTDNKSHVYKHVAQTRHVINEEDFSIIIGSGDGNYKKRKISEAFHIHQKKPNLNKQKESVPLKLFI